MNVEEDQRGLKVLGVFEGSPAEKAGIRAGRPDHRRRTAARSPGVDSDVATARIKGPPGTEVRLEVVTPRSKRSARACASSAREIDVPVAESRIVERDGKKLGVVTLFTLRPGGTHGSCAGTVERVLEQGADGIVLDLRGNGGGLLQEAVLVASIFIEDGVIVSARGRTKPEREFEDAGATRSRTTCRSSCSWTAAARARPRS